MIEIMDVVAHIGLGLLYVIAGVAALTDRDH